jgi:sulfite exporter TauE/SafE
MQLWPAFLLGLVGSLHCAGMCGPLALALPATGDSRVSFTAGRLAYNAGRITTYCLLGALFGLVGMTFALAGLQRWASISAGAAILLGLLASARRTLNTPVSRAVARVRAGLGVLLHRRTMGSIYSLGVLNGFLPCGLVYVGCAGAVATGGFLPSMGYMAAFGLGTVPMMLSLGLAGKMFHTGIRLKFQKLVPVCLLMLGALLVLRGIYVIPDAGGHKVTCPFCRAAATRD